MEKFAKLFESKKYGQILLLKQVNADTDELELHYKFCLDGDFFTSILSFSDLTQSTFDNMFNNTRLEVAEGVINCFILEND